ncbi:hypothetical protein BGZ65_011504, partial [Modicella reniformis]
MQKKLRKDLLAAIDAADADLRHLSLLIHDHPELGYEEHFAHKTLTDYLSKQGFNVTRHACGIETAFIAEFVHHHHGGDSADSSHATAPMRSRGAFKGLDVCIMLHPAQFDVLYRQPLGVGRLEIEFHGKASHASTSPWEGINALDAVAMTYNAIGLFRQQTLPTNRIHSIVTNGGQASNIIPELASMTTLYRAQKPADLAKLHDQLIEIIDSAAEASGCTVKVEKTMEYLPLNTNPPLADRFGSYMKSFGVHYNSREVDEATPAGSTDMGNVTAALPGIHPVFNIASLDGVREPGLSTHSTLFAERARTEVAHKAVIRAAKSLSLTGLDVLLDA